jgi:3-isopropylmalate/(R)-2-methylmalate dehydratase small subunit
MKPFTNLEGRVAPLAVNNIDTDQIIPARFLKTTSKEGMDKQLFNDWRYDAEGRPKPDFILNQPRAQGVEVLLAGDNFGCGSSREHAPWALTQWGFRAVISTSFGDIFKQNSLKNSLLPVTVPADVLAELFAAVEADPAATVKIDLGGQTLTTPRGRAVRFPIDEFAKGCLLNGVDELGYILRQGDNIAAYEAAHPAPVNCQAAC